MEELPLDQQPAMPPPPGFETDFVDPPSRQPAIIAMSAVFVSLMLLAVSVRAYTRTRILKSWGWDDTTCIIAVIGSLANLGSFMKLLDLGLGLHMWDIPVTVFMSESNARFLAAGITYPWTVGFTKISILLLYKRLFPVAKMRIAIWVGIAIIGILYGSFIIMSAVNIGICVTVGTDISPFCDFVHTGLVIWQGASNVVTDFYLVVLPIPQVLKLKLSRKKKIGLCLTFASGLGACGASIARLIISVKNIYGGWDVMWVSGEIALYSIAEVNIGIIVACVFTFPVFLTRLRESKVCSKLKSSLGLSGQDSGSSSVLPIREQHIIRAVGPGVSEPGDLAKRHILRAMEIEWSVDSGQSTLVSKSAGKEEGENDVKSGMV
ncbi:hypothetical protein ASPSYDRAFT_84214 [Aspergillus sydowii CBS 593.65]|uniref:Rhodopsin domain-containing protein n=1 Tax=Aspergillus sydowii CBS 593.65 TaxID=1036612 RepID=A0A1L9TXT4_9EURO|nr:uncharacterized protein ASPSYDRAFT_84214 [Aspergillus sydowii CBS 593.65]OJJ64192.1 hypothetical protein ASPSYDRAFT_84214 [Aspergillus sydowii CBS 593.65]